MKAEYDLPKAKARRNPYASSQRLIDECLVPYLHDRKDAWSLGADGEYRSIDGHGVSAQQALMRLHDAGRAGAG